MSQDELPGKHFEAEIREQPDIWRRLSRSEKAREVAEAVHGKDVILVGSGSSLFVAQLGAIAMRTRGIRAHAIASTEASVDHAIYRGSAAIVCSQSGRSADVLNALDVLQPRCLVAITNTPESPLWKRADVRINAACGPEIAVPASKTVTTMAAILLWTASLLAGSSQNDAGELHRAADALDDWLGGSGFLASISDAAVQIAECSSLAIVGSGFGLPVALEFALKIKEASYMHAEGFAAGEFRHGAAAMIDSTFAIAGIIDERSDRPVRRALDEAAQTGALRYAVGQSNGDLPVLGPAFTGPFDALCRLVTGQMLALTLGRVRGIESDAPRGLKKAIL